MYKKCCINCFSHEWLLGYVHENSRGKGRCDYCGSKRAELIAIADLYDLFQNLMELYTPSDDPHGEPLIDLIQWDYEVFGEDLYSSGGAARLLEDIMWSGWDDDDGEPPVDAHELYYQRASLWYHTTRAAEFDEFCEKVKENPTEELNLHELFEEELARTEAELTQVSTIYRARVGFIDDGQQGIKPLEGRDIGAPPPDKARAARANAEGEVVLYTADQEATAIAEVRPWRGILVSVAEIRTSRKLRLVDLNNSPPVVNPFSDEAPQYESELVELLVAFGMELGRPLRRADDARDYLPCQKLVRRIRETGLYDGIRYPSAMTRGGTNVAIFDPTLTQVGPSRLIQISDVGISYGAPEED
jgi:RES domain